LLKTLAFAGWQVRHSSPVPVFFALFDPKNTNPTPVHLFIRRSFVNL